MRRLLGLLALALVAVASAGAAPTQFVERLRLADAGKNLTEGLPPGVFLLLTAPPEYTRQSSELTSGRWIGPEYSATGKPDLRGRSAIEWRLRFDIEAKKTDEAAKAALIEAGREDIRGGISVPHVVGRQVVGTLDGDFIITEGWGQGDAQYEAAVAFPLAPRLLAIVNFIMREPAIENAGGFGQYVVKDIPAALWNRGQAFRSLAGIRIDGNLLPTRISLVAASAGQAVRGTVADAFRHPLVRARVALQRLEAEGWQTLTSTKTTARGTFSMRIGARGQYRAVVTVGKTTLTSVTVRAGR